MAPLSRVLLLINHLNVLSQTNIIHSWTIPGLNNALDAITLQPGISCEIPFRLFPLRSPLLREYVSCETLFSFPPLTEMFHFSGLALAYYYTSNFILLKLGFPIQTSPDQRLLATSPMLIAGTPRPSSL